MRRPAMVDPDLDRFEQVYRLADKLTGVASKAELAEVAPILALGLAHYQAKYGELSAEEYVSLAPVDSLTPELANTLADGMENLVGVLVHLTGYADPGAETH